MTEKIEDFQMDKIDHKESKKTTKNFQTGIASEYLVLSMLYRLGADAYITLGNRKSIDIWVIQDENHAISIDVKSVRDYSSIPVDHVQGLPNHYIVFVVYKKKFSDLKQLPDIYVVPSEEVVRRRVTFNTYYRIMKGDIDEFKDRWDLIVEEDL